MCYWLEEDELLQGFQAVEEKQLWKDEVVGKCTGREFTKNWESVQEDGGGKG